MTYTLASSGWFATVGDFSVVRKPLPAKCYYFGWPTRGPIGVMLHGTAGCSSDIFAVLESRGISAHFNIARDGTIFQYVSLNNRAAHAYDANHKFFAIEHTGQNNACKWYTQAQLASSVELSAALVEWAKRKWDNVIPPEHVSGEALVRGFKEHYDGCNPTAYWNPNVHVDRPGSHWGWDTYLTKVQDILDPPKTYWLVNGKRFNRLHRALRFIRRSLSETDLREIDVKVKED